MVLTLRNPNLRSSLSQLSAPELVIAGAQMFIIVLHTNALHCNDKVGVRYT